MFKLYSRIPLAVLSSILLTDIPQQDKPTPHIAAEHRPRLSPNQGYTRPVHLAAVQPTLSPGPSYPDLAKAVYRANPFPYVTNLFCRIPLHHIILFARDCSPWRPDAE